MQLLYNGSRHIAGERWLIIVALYIATHAHPNKLCAHAPSCIHNSTSTMTEGTKAPKLNFCEPWTQVRGSRRDEPAEYISACMCPVCASSRLVCVSVCVSFSVKCILRLARTTCPPYLNPADVARGVYLFAHICPVLPCLLCLRPRTRDSHGSPSIRMLPAAYNAFAPFRGGMK